MSWKSLIIGCMVGAGAGLILAPASGRTTRAKIRDKAVGVGHDVSDFVGSKSRHVANKVKGYQHKAVQATEKVKELVGAGRDKTQQPEMAMSGEPTI
jgi:gas vesicle protein